MRQKVKLFIQKCPVCQKNSQEYPIIHTMPFTKASYEPMERINIDTIGPLPLAENGSQYILVVIDCFTCFIELYDTISTDSNEAARCLL